MRKLECVKKMARSQWDETKDVGMREDAFRRSLRRHDGIRDTCEVVRFFITVSRTSYQILGKKIRMPRLMCWDRKGNCSV